MRRYHPFSGFAIWVATILLLSSPLLGDVTGTIRGTVSDPSGAVIPGATVRLHNPLTGFKRLASSDSAGYYQFLAVPVGDGYEVSVDAKGFKVAVLAGIKLLVNQVYQADFRLEVGTVAERVQVTAASVQVETTSTQLGDVISDNKMTALPLNGRSYTDLLGLQAGVVALQSNIATHGQQDPSGDLFAGNLSVNGSREMGEQFLVNGTDVEEPKNNGAAVIPTLDSIQEFRILTNTFDAEYGHFGGAVVNVITKSGTNDLHGAVYEFLRNNALDSRNFFALNQHNVQTGQELPGTAIGSLKQNMFGGAMGGPIRKNRLFFFADYQGTRNVTGVSTGVINVPSAQERTGDFSDVGVTGYAALTGTVRGSNTPGLHTMPETLTQRLGYTVLGGEPYWVPGCNTLADAQAGMCVFPGQVIPQAAWSPVPKATLKFIPLPTGTLGAGTPYFSTTSNKATLRDDKFGLRFDLNSQRAGSWAFYYHFDDATSFDPYAGGNVGGFGATTPVRSQNVSVSNTRNFGANSVNVARLSFTRMATDGATATQGLGPINSFGFVQGGLGIIPGAGVQGLPPIGLNQLGVNLGIPYLDVASYDNSFQAQDSYSRVVGRHTIKLGGEFRNYQIPDRYLAIQNGDFTFYGNETGNDFADFLLGAPDGFQQSSYAAIVGKSKYYGVYAEDSFKARRNLTLNYGLRWEVAQPWYDTQNRLQAFSAGEQSKLYPDAPKGWIVAGDPGIPRGMEPTRYHDFAPRLGIAFSPDTAQGLLGKLFGGPGRTSIRAGFGVFFQATEQLSNYYQLGNAPFSNFWVTNTPIYFEEPYKDRIQGADPGQRFPFVVPSPGATGFWAQFLPISYSGGTSAEDTNPYMEQYNFNIQRQIGQSAIFSIGYVGSQGHHLLSQTEANLASPAKCLQIAAQLIALGRSGEACGPFGEDTIYNISPGVTYYGTRPYSVTSGRSLNQGLMDFGTLETYLTVTNSAYNALQASLEKRVGAVRFLGAYTWSKSLDNGSGFVDGPDQGMNPFNRNLSRAPSAFNMAHNFVLSYSYDLPFQRALQSRQGSFYKFLSGWQLSGINRFTTGLPVNMRESDDRTLCNCFGVGTPDWNGQLPQIFDPRKSASHQYFSTGQFSEVKLGQLGTSDTRIFSGPGLNNWDLALHKLTQATERISVEFRAELFNAFNHAQFNSPNGATDSSSFGTVKSARDPRIGQVALKFTF